MGNTVGSREFMKTIKSKNGQFIQLSKKQEDILLGCVLGDAYITKRGQFQIEHTVHQKEYLFWKYGQLKTISYGDPSKVVRKDQRHNREYMSYRFWTRQFFRKWRERFYRSGVKEIPIDLKKLSPLSIAIWYMDDGYLSGKKMMFATEGFNKRSLYRIQDIFFKKLNVQTNLKKRGTLIVGTRESRKLISSIRRYIIPSMSYKIP